MKITQRIKRAYKAFNGEEKPLLVIHQSEMDAEQAQKVSKLTGSVIVLANDVDNYKYIQKEEGDGKAEFFGEGTTEEWEELVREDKGELPWYKRILEL